MSKNNLENNYRYFELDAFVIYIIFIVNMIVCSYLIYKGIKNTLC